MLPNQSHHPHDCLQKRRDTASTGTSEEVDEQPEQACRSSRHEKKSLDMSPPEQHLNSFVNVIVRKVAEDLINHKRSNSSTSDDASTASQLNGQHRAFDLAAVTKLIQESVDLATSSDDDDVDVNVNDDDGQDHQGNHNYDHDAHSVHTTYVSISGESKASTDTSSSSHVTLHTFLGDAPAEEVFHPDFWCADLEETLDQHEKDALYDEIDDLSEVSNLSMSNEFVRPPTRLQKALQKSKHYQVPMPSVEIKTTSPTTADRHVPKKPKSSSMSHGKDTTKSRSTFQYVVKFTDITVREYPQILGQNPGCSNGPSLSIGWEYRELPALPVRDFEKLRSHFRHSKQLLLSREQREKRLRRIGYSAAEIAEAVRRDNKSRAQRRQTVTTMGMYEALINTKSKVLRGLFLLPTNSERNNSNNNTKVREWWCIDWLVDWSIDRSEGLARIDL